MRVELLFFISRNSTDNISLNLSVVVKQYVLAAIGADEDTPLAAAHGNGKRFR